VRTATDRLLKRFFHGLLLAAAILAAAPAAGKLVRIEIERREPLADGHAFGQIGPYEKLAGRLHFEVDPDDPANAAVVDLGLAPRNARRRVEFWSDFYLLRPQDPERGNRRLLVGINNRGNKLLLGAFNDRGGNDPTTPADTGNGFLMRRGYTLFWCGWNADVLPGDNRLCLGVPQARKEGAPLEGKVYAEICVDRKAFSAPLAWGNTNVYPSASLDSRTARLTMRPRRTADPVEIPPERWSFARWEDGRAIPDPTHLYVEEGLRPGWLYDLVYTATGSRVTGLGFCAVRDAVAFLRYGEADESGTPNPLAGGIDRAYVFGISQSGRFIHHFVHEGFNADAEGRLVFDAAMPHVAGAGKGFFNHRFAQTTRYGSPHEEHLFPCDFFPLTTVPQKDPVTGEEGDTLAAARARKQLPKIFFTQTSAEYWCRAASLLHTDTEGARDVPLDPNVRIYFIAGAQHIISDSPAKGIYQYPRNVLDHRPPLRALLVALDRWASEGEPPPPSRYPTLADGTLTTMERYRETFPRIPGVTLPEGPFAPLRLDFGPRWRSEGIADHVPPRVGPAYGTRIAAVDADGNDLGGIRLPAVAVPLATYTGWNLRAAEYGAEGMPARFFGACFPFARTDDERRQTGDPRRSILERYPARKDYVERVRAVNAALVREGFLLEEDAARIEASTLAEPHWN
jgi:hypothetical protein